MEGKRGARRFLDVLNSKPVIGAFIFIMLSLVSVWAGNIFVNEGNLDIDNNLNSSGMLYVNSTNVGIGLINPVYLLDVFGPINLLATSDGASGGGQITINKGTADNNGGSVVIQSGIGYTAGGNVSISAGSGTFGAVGNVQIYTREGGLGGGSFGNILLSVNETGAAGGKVGIGVSKPAYALEIGNSNLIGQTKSLNVSGIMYVGDSKVGIGTKSPSMNLEVAGNTTVREMINEYTAVQLIQFG